MTALINGVEENKLDVNSRAIHYGDGLFETIAVKDAKALYLDYHFNRLKTDCLRLGILMPDLNLLRSEVTRLCVNELKCVIKIIIIRAYRGRGYASDNAGSECDRILIREDWPERNPDYSTLGVRVKICKTRLAIQPALAGMKHLNRLEQVLGRSEWKSADIAEGLMMDTQGRLIEGTFSNLFVVKQGELITPDLSSSGVCGVMRQVILDYCKDSGIKVTIGFLKPEDLFHANEVFLSNSLIGIWPVIACEKMCFSVGKTTKTIATEINAAQP